MLTRMLVLSVALSQEESVSFRPPNVPRVALISGERVAFLLDGGCTCQAESRVPAAPAACNGAGCTASRARARAQVLDALDGGAPIP